MEAPGETFPEIRESVRKLCTRFPGEYWRRLDAERAYPTEFVRALTESGFLSVLIPEKYGGSGLGLGLGAATAILEEIHRSGCNGGACHAQMYTMGTSCGTAATRRSGPAGNRRGHAAPPDLRRDRADQRNRHHPHPHRRPARGRPLHRQRPEGVDLARRAFRPDGPAGPHHPARRGRQAGRGDERPAGGPAKGGRQRPDHPADPHHDQSRHDRAVLRQSGGPGREPDRGGG